MQKEKSNGKKTKKQYDYVLVSKFHGPTSDHAAAFSPPLITCKVSNDIQEPFFGMPAKDLRKMAAKSSSNEPSSDDYERSKELIKTGGQRLLHELLYHSNKTYEMSLYHTANEFFHQLDDDSAPQALDGTVPILEIRKRASAPSTGRR